MNLYQYADFLRDWHLGASNAVKGLELARAFGVSNRASRGGGDNP